ncbi:MAG: FAD-dependent oxidoreductase [Firmicutes bacterium]|nr:FAD-dependent oxidoreductase [Bacillota bacterium]
MKGTKQKAYDVAIIGAGPCGLTAAIYACRQGLSVILFDKGTPGGQAAQTEKIENYPGFAEGVGGFELMSAAFEQATALCGAEYVGVEVTEIRNPRGKIKRLATTEGTFDARTVILSMGASAKKLGLPGEERLTGRGVSYCATCDGNFFRGKDVAVNGGGNTAVTDALYLSKLAASVTLIHRREQFRAEDALVRRLSEVPNIRLMLGCTVAALKEEGGKLAGLTVRGGDGGETMLAVSGLFVAVGSESGTGLVKGVVKTDEAGYIVVKNNLATNIPGVFAGGDCIVKRLRQVVTACADGAVCADSAGAYLSVKDDSSPDSRYARLSGSVE